MLRKLAVLVLGMFVLAGSAFAAPIISIGSATAHIGSTAATIDITISGVDNLYSYQFDVLYDPSIATYSGTTEGDFFTAGGNSTSGVLEDTSAGPGTVNLAVQLFGPASSVSGGGTLLTLSFFGYAPGTSPVTLDNIFLIQEDLSQITDFTVNNGSIASVPVPGSMFLLGSGLVGLLGVIRRKLNR